MALYGNGRMVNRQQASNGYQLLILGPMCIQACIEQSASITVCMETHYIQLYAKFVCYALYIYDSVHSTPNNTSNTYCIYSALRDKPTTDIGNRDYVYDFRVVVSWCFSLVPLTENAFSRSSN